MPVVPTYSNTGRSSPAFNCPPLNDDAASFTYPSPSSPVEKSNPLYRTLPYLTAQNLTDNTGDWSASVIAKEPVTHTTLKRSMSEGLKRRNNPLLKARSKTKREDLFYGSQEKPSTLTIPRRTDSKDPINLKSYGQMSPDDLHTLRTAALKRLNAIFKHYKVKPLPTDVLKTLQTTVNGQSRKKWWKPWKKSEPKESLCESLLKSPMALSVEHASVPCGVMESQSDPRRIPVVVHECVQFLKAQGLESTGIFRVNGSERRMAQLAKQFDTPPTYGMGSSFEGYTVYDVADFLKKYLRGVPEPLFTSELYSRFLKCLDIPAEGGTRIRAIRLLLMLLPPTHLVLLETLLEFFGQIVHYSEANQMNAHSLARIFSPNLLRPTKVQKQPLEEYERCSYVVEFLIDNWSHFIITASTVRPAQILDLTYINATPPPAPAPTEKVSPMEHVPLTLTTSGVSQNSSRDTPYASRISPSFIQSAPGEWSTDQPIVQRLHAATVRRVRTAPTKRSRASPLLLGGEEGKLTEISTDIDGGIAISTVYGCAPPTKKLRAIGSMTNLRRRTLATDPTMAFSVIS
ncbi:Rho GTPase activation protein [Phlyctochytrium arcticum]|nr:Rho GTPase activation protein [Phlyctochytrium arcticum]